MKKLSLYLLVVILTMYIFILYDNFSLFPLIVGQLLFLLINFFILFITKKHLTASLKLKNKIINKNNIAPIEIVVKNNSWFPVAKYEVKISFDNPFSNNNETVTLQGTIASKKQTILTCDVKANYCGVVNCQIVNINNYDLLNMFKLTKKSTISKKIIVLPNSYFVNIIFGLERYANQQIETIVSNEITEENLSNYNIREYQVGDHFKKIHWKISAKTNQLMIREMLASSTKDIYLVLHLNRNSHETPMNIDMIDALLEATLTISNALLKESCIHILTWYDFSLEKIVAYEITNHELLQQAIQQILTNCLSWINIPLINVPIIDTKQNFVIALDRNLYISLNNEPIYQLDYQNVEASLNKLYLTI